MLNNTLAQKGMGVRESLVRVATRICEKNSYAAAELCGETSLAYKGKWMTSIERVDKGRRCGGPGVRAWEDGRGPT